MASITLRLDNRTTKDGMQQVRIRISHNSTNAWVPTGIWVEPAYFSNELYAPIQKGARMASDKNDMLAAQVSKYKKYLTRMEDNDPNALAGMSANDIRDCVRGVRVVRQQAVKHEKEVKTADDDFMELLNQYGLSRSNENSRRMYAFVWNVVYEYTKYAGMRKMSVKDVDYRLLCDMKRWLRKERRGDNTRYKVESCMRAVYKEAERMRLVDRNVNPYFDYKIEPIPEKDIEVLDVDVIRKLLALDLRGVCGVDRARDILMASFYLCGANLIDLYNMPKCGKECVFVRHKVEGKTKRALHIKIEDELGEIIGKWSGKDRMLDIADRSSNYYTAQRRLNRQMDVLGDKLGVNINMGIMRRTWATIASELEVPDRVIDKSMGHMDSSVKDRYYERYDWSRTAKYNRQIIDYIWEGVVPNSICC